MWFFCEPTRYLGEPAPRSIGGSLTTSTTLRLGVKRLDNLVRGTWRPPFFVEKLLSGNRDQGDRGFVHGRDLIAEKRYS